MRSANDSSFGIEDGSADPGALDRFGGEQLEQLRAPSTTSRSKRLMEREVGERALQLGRAVLALVGRRQEVSEHDVRVVGVCSAVGSA